MKFRLETSKYFYHDGELSVLEELGFKFLKNGPINNKDDYTPSIDINSLDELIALSEKVGFPLVFDNSSIEIYDDYRE